MPMLSFDPAPDEREGELQSLVDALFSHGGEADSLQLVTLAEVRDVDPDVLEIVNLLPYGSYTRPQMADQLNSIITAHGWSATCGTVA